jgi:hypothetical protein
MRRLVAPSFVLLALFAIAFAWSASPVRPVLAGALFALGPGYVTLRLLRRESSSLAFELGMALALSPFVVGLLATALLFAGLDIRMAALVLAVATGGGAAYVAWRDRVEPTTDAGDEFRARTGLAAWLIALTLATACIWPAVVSNRVRASVHGMLHASILMSAVEHGVPPENPFFADRPLRYYWMFHVGAAATGALGDVDPTIAFAIGNGAALLAFALLLARLGADAFRSKRAAALSVVFGFLGLNPLGGFEFLTKQPGHEPIAELTDLARGRDPILYIQALAVDDEDRITATFTKFMNVSSFPQALALLVASWILVVALSRKARASTFALLATCVAGGLALSPITGASAGLASGIAAGLVFLRRARDATLRRRPLLIAGALVLGLAVALPLILLSAGNSENAIGVGPTATKVVRTLLNLGPLALLALPALLWLRRALTPAPEDRDALAQLWLNALLLMGLGVVLHFAVNSEYKLIRMASPLLGVLAAGAVALLFMRLRRIAFASVVVLLVAPFVPTNAIAWNAYRWHARADLPFTGVDGRIVLDPGAHPIATAYEWLRTKTPPDAIVLAHPLNVDHAHPDRNRAHFAGMLHGDEIPVLAHRPVFADNVYYMTDYEPDLPARHQLIGNLYAGRALSQSDIELLSELRRPVYFLVRAEDPDPGRAVFAAKASRGFKQVYADAWATIFEFRP